MGDIGNLKVYKKSSKVLQRWSALFVHRPQFNSYVRWLMLACNSSSRKSNSMAYMGTSICAHTPTQIHKNDFYKSKKTKHYGYIFPCV